MHGQLHVPSAGAPIAEPLEWYTRDFPAFVAKVLGVDQQDYAALRARYALLFGMQEDQAYRELRNYATRAPPQGILQQPPQDLSWFTDAVSRVLNLPLKPPDWDIVSPAQYAALRKYGPPTPGIKQPNRHARRRVDRSRR